MDCSSLLYTYGVSCRGSFTDKKDTLRQWIAKEKKEGGGDSHVVQRWNLPLDELDALMRRLE